MLKKYLVLSRLLTSKIYYCRIIMINKVINNLKNMIRQAAVAGSFYPANKKELENLIEKYLANVKLPELTGEIKALICPHAGYIYSGQVAAFGYKLLEKKKYKDAVIFGPSHRYQFDNLALGDFESWETPLGKISVSELYKKLSQEKYFQNNDDAHELEHSIEVQLPFIQMVLKNSQITPISTGTVNNHKLIAETLKKYLNSETLIIASSDLSHYQYYLDAEEDDRHTIEEICRLEKDISHDEACGADGIKILIELAKLMNWKPQLLKYQNSGDITDNKDEVVGYAAIVFTAS
jgi:MEMO1 family protein